MRFIAGILLLAFCLTGCNYSDEDKIVLAFMKEAQPKYNLKYKASVYSFVYGKDCRNGCELNHLYVKYEAKKPYDEVQARKLMIDLTEDYIKFVNKSPAKNKVVGPVSEKNGDLVIVYVDTEGNSLGEVRSEKSEVIFKQANQHGKVIESGREPYAEAYSKVYGTKPPERV